MNIYYKYYTGLQSGYFPDLWKTTVVNRLLKKPGLDPIFKNWLPTEDAYENGVLSHHMKIKEGANPLFDRHTLSGGPFPSLEQPK